MDYVGKMVSLHLSTSLNSCEASISQAIKKILYLSELLGICEVIDSNGQKYV